MLNVRVQGAIRSYAAGMLNPTTFAILKNDNGYTELARMTVPEQKNGVPFTVAVTAKGNCLTAVLNGSYTLAAEDKDHPYLTGAIGVSVQEGAHLSCRYLQVKPVE